MAIPSLPTSISELITNRKRKRLLLVVGNGIVAAFQRAVSWSDQRLPSPAYVLLYQFVPCPCAPSLIHVFPSNEYSTHAPSQSPPGHSSIFNARLRLNVGLVMPEILKQGE